MLTPVQPPTLPDGPDGAAIATALSRDEVLTRLDRLARRGQLPGFTRGGGGGLFSVDVHGQPFDAVMLASAEGREGATVLRMHVRMHRRLPVIFAIVLAATIWPGVYFTDQLIPGEWGLIRTEWWYLPLTVVPIPWVWRALMRRSRESNRAEAEETLKKIAAEIEGTQATPR
jgi:hypothetical protein